MPSRRAKVVRLPGIPVPIPESRVSKVVDVPKRMPDTLVQYLINYIVNQSGSVGEREDRAADVILLIGQLCPSLNKPEL